VSAAVGRPSVHPSVRIRSLFLSLSLSPSFSFSRPLCAGPSCVYRFVDACYLPLSLSLPHRLLPFDPSRLSAERLIILVHRALISSASPTVFRRPLINASLTINRRRALLQCSKVPLISVNSRIAIYKQSGLF